MKINLFKKEFKTYNNKVVKCTLFARVTMFDGRNVLCTEPFVVFGRAKCHKEDVFDPEVGQRKAYERAYTRLLNKVYKYTTDEVKYLENALTHAKRDQEKSVKLIEKNKASLV